MKGISERSEEVRLANSGITQISGGHNAAGFTFGLAVSRFNDAITLRLAEAAVSCLKEHGARENDITIAWVPGAFELPLTLQRLAEKNKFSALIGLGAVVKGETPHASLITAEVTRALSDLARVFHLPVIDGVLATENWAQAEARSGARENNRGWYAALAAIEMANLMKRI